MPLLSLLRTVDDIAGILVSKITIFVSYMSKMIAAPVSHSSAFGNLLCPLFRYACMLLLWECMLYFSYFCTYIEISVRLVQLLGSSFAQTII